MAIIFVVAQRFAIVCLIFAAKVRTTTFFAIESITTHQHAQLEEVINTASLFKGLVDALTRASDAQIFFELAIERWQFRQCFFEALLRALNTAIVPNDFAQLTMKPIR